MVAAGVPVIPDDLACVVDARVQRCRRGRMDSREWCRVGRRRIRVVEETVVAAIGIDVIADDLARVVDAGGNGAADRPRDRRGW